MVTSYLSLGSNMGDRLRNLTDAVKMLDDTKGIEVSKVSSIYETEPIGYKDQDDFLNICVKVRTDLAPGELLDRCHEIENELKRVRRIRNGPRTIGLDILEYGDVTSDDPVLILPHPRMTVRAFVVIPYNEISDRELEVPGDGDVRRWGDFPLWRNSI